MGCLNRMVRGYKPNAAQASGQQDLSGKDDRFLESNESLCMYMDFESKSG